MKFKITKIAEYYCLFDFTCIVHKLLLDLKYMHSGTYLFLVAHKVTLLLMLKRRMNKNVMNLNNRAKAGKIQSA